MDPIDFEDLMRQQNMMMRAVANESETDSKIKMLDIINSLVTDRNRKVQKELILIQAENEGMSASEAERVLQVLIEDNIIIEPERGYIKRA
jgi:DNA replicative helicase MCM subunit Mcm2 (Cdc46/Mcm family)